MTVCVLALVLSFPTPYVAVQVRKTEEYRDPCIMPCGMSNVQARSNTSKKGFSYCQKIQNREACDKSYLWQDSADGIIKPCHWKGDFCDTHHDERDWVHNCPVDPAASKCMKTDGAEGGIKSDEKRKAENSRSTNHAQPQSVEHSSQAVEGVSKILRVELPLSTGAACLDGSPYAFSIVKGNPKYWTIQFDGGGNACSTVEDCEKKIATHYGTSSIQDDRSDISCSCRNYNGKHHEDCTCVYLAYCDGAYFLNHRDDPYKTPSGKKLYLRGRLNLRASLDILLKSYGLAGATDLVVTGESTGGLTAILNMDTVAGAMPKSMTVRGVPVAGFVPHVNTCCSWDSCCYNQCCYNNGLSLTYSFHNLESSLSSDCIASNAEKPWMCLLSSEATSFVNTPMFIINSKYDSFQLKNLAGMPYKGIYREQAGIKDLVNPVREYGVEFVKQLVASTKKTNHAAYITACICHAACSLTGNSVNSEYQGEWVGDLIVDWYKESGHGTGPSLFIDDAGPNYDCDEGGIVGSVKLYDGPDEV